MQRDQRKQKSELCRKVTNNPEALGRLVNGQLGERQGR